MRTIFLWCLLFLFATAKSQSVSLPDSISVYQFTTDSVKTVLKTKKEISTLVSLLESRKRRLIKFGKKYNIVLHEGETNTVISASWKNIRMKEGTFRIRKNIDNYFSKLDFKKY